MNMSYKFRRHREVAAAQAETELVNCALLCLYKYGQCGGWYAVASGHIDGFRADYALVLSNPGDFACHPVRAFYAASAEELVEYATDLQECRQAVADNHGGELPLVEVLSQEEVSAAVAKVREALDNDAPEDPEEWLRRLCGIGPSDVRVADFAATLAAIRRHELA
jgi:hypothetical protein